jgi:hypothetical protein
MATIPFLTGFTVKPKTILQTGTVIFTDGTNDVTPNQLECEAYGYTYNETLGTCTTYVFNTNVNENISNTANTIKGAQNTAEVGTNNNLILGESNTIKSQALNNLIVGDNNEVFRTVNNATILGNYGIAQRQGEVVIGGGSFNGVGKGYGQSSTMTLSGTTTDATVTNLKVNSSSSDTIIFRQSGVLSFQGFEANVIGVRTGGTAAGSTYDRIFLRATGLVFLKNASQSVATLGSFGTVSGWTAAVAFSGTNDMHFTVTGAANMNLSWSVTLHLYEMIV